MILDYKPIVKKVIIDTFIYLFIGVFIFLLCYSIIGNPGRKVESKIKVIGTFSFEDSTCKSYDVLSKPEPGYFSTDHKLVICDPPITGMVSK